MVEFILSLSVLIVSAFRPVYHGGKACELTGYRANNAVITTQVVIYGFFPPLAWLPQ